MASDVDRATPPRVEEAADGRTKASGCFERSCIRVLSPRSAPWVRCEEGSTAKTATRAPRRTASSPNRSINVLLPAPGIPVSDAHALPCTGGEAQEGFVAVWWSGWALSTQVMACANASRCPSRTALASVSGVQAWADWMSARAASRARERAFCLEAASEDMMGRYVKADPASVRSARTLRACVRC